MSLAAVLDRLKARAAVEPSLRETLEYLANDVAEDPFATPPAPARELARSMNRRRQIDRAAQLQERSLTTGEVVRLVPSISDRKAVDRRRKRGTLLGVRSVGQETMHPRWQFDMRRRDTYLGLPEVLAALHEMAADAIDADAIATAARDEAGGASIADLLAEGNVRAAVSLAYLAGDQS